MKKLISFPFFLLLLSGCASTMTGGTPHVENMEEAGEVVVIRPKTSAGTKGRLNVTLDGEDAFKLAQGESVSFYLPPGDYQIGVRCFGGWSPTSKHMQRDFTVAPQETFYFNITSSVLSTGCADIDQMPEREGRQWTQVVRAADL